MQAITTKFIPPTNTRGARIKAQCDRGEITIGFHSVPNEPHKAALISLVKRFLIEDQHTYGTRPDENPWRGPWIEGGLPGNGGSVFVCIGRQEGFEVKP